MDADTDPLAGLLPGTTTNADPIAPSGFDTAGTFGAVSGTGAGRYGFATAALGGAGVSGAIESVWDWLNAPFTKALSPVNVFLFVGVVMAAIVLWNLVLYHIRVAAEEI